MPASGRAVSWIVADRPFLTSVNVEVVAGAVADRRPTLVQRHVRATGETLRLPRHPSPDRRGDPRSVPCRGIVADPSVVGVHALGADPDRSRRAARPVLGFWGIVPLAVTIGVLAGLVQMLGLLRWVSSFRRWLAPKRSLDSGTPDSGRRASPSSERCTSTWVSASATSGLPVHRHRGPS